MLLFRGSLAGAERTLLSMSSSVITVTLGISCEEAINLVHLFAKFPKVTHTLEHILLLGGNKIEPSRTAIQLVNSGSRLTGFVYHISLFLMSRLILDIGEVLSVTELGNSQHCEAQDGCLEHPSLLQLGRGDHYFILFIITIQMVVF